MSSANLTIVEADPALPEAASLISALDAELRERYPGLPIHGIDPLEFRRANGVFLLGILDGVAVACGALRPLSGGAAELKRMFVRSGHRGRGFAKAMLAALERIATGRGYRSISPGNRHLSARSYGALRARGLSAGPMLGRVRLRIQVPLLREGAAGVSGLAARAPRRVLLSPASTWDCRSAPASN
jgi:GNAT superfamily N-acetyltransferase